MNPLQRYARDINDAILNGQKYGNIYHGHIRVQRVRTAKWHDEYGLEFKALASGSWWKVTESLEQR